MLENNRQMVRAATLYRIIYFITCNISFEDKEVDA